MPEYIQYWMILGDISSITPVEQQTESSFSWPNRLKGNIDIFSISLPSPVSDSTRAHLNGLKNLQRAGGGGKPHLIPYSFTPTKVWLLGMQEVEGIEVETKLHICWGANRKEKDFKEHLSPGDTRTRLDKFMENAQSAGAICTREEHCNFMRISIHGI